MYFPYPTLVGEGEKIGGRKREGIKGEDMSDTRKRSMATKVQA